MWQREFWWNATLPWNRCSFPCTKIFIPLATFQFLLHLDEKFTLGSKFIIQVIHAIFCSSPNKHLFSGSWRDPLVHLSRRAGATKSSDRWLDGQDIGAHCWGCGEEVKAEKKLGMGPSTRWRYRSYFEGDCRKWTVPKWFEELRLVSNWGSRIYQSNIFLCHLTQSSAHKS